jgi:tRNA-2-methylthio-N6-dimethylallyladenosine synthase
MARVKFTTSFPRDFHPDIVAAIDEYPNLCDWVHLPVQSGSDRILKEMRRGHKIAEYREKISAIKNARRRIAITSDIIVGYPGETEHDFVQTMDLVRECEYDALYIFKYSQRKGTPAGKLADSVSELEKKERFLQLEALQRTVQNRVYSDYLGRHLSVLVEGPSARSVEDMSGHSTCHKVVNFRGHADLEGEMVKVVVTQTKTNSLFGTLLN